MFFLAELRSTDIMESLRSREMKDSIQVCAQKLKEECANFDFNLDDTYCDIDDINKSSSFYQENRLDAWETFFNSLFTTRENSDNIQRKTCYIFQFIYYMLHNGRKKTPLHISLAQSIHDKTRSKQLIQIFNRMGICISYDEIERIDNGLTYRTIARASENRVPIPPSIIPNILINGAMDNFDHEKNTSSGTGGSHDTILMLFQNIDDKTELPPLQNSIKPKNINITKHNLDCQQLVPFNKPSYRADIPTDFIPGTFAVSNIHESSMINYATWCMSRYVTSDRYPLCSNRNVSKVPSFTATNSLLSNVKPVLTSIGFTPIIPYPATEYDTIYTCMKNFQDILLQMNLKEGPLWCDEGVYRIAKNNNC